MHDIDFIKYKKFNFLYMTFIKSAFLLIVSILSFSKGIIFLFLILSFGGEIVFGQRITYDMLRNRAQQPNLFFEPHILPDSAGEKHHLVVTFRIEYPYFTFRRYREGASSDSRGDFYANPSIRFLIHKHDPAEVSGEPPAPVKMLSWNKTIFAKTYDETQSKKRFVEDKVSAKLAPGRYHVEIIMDSKQPSGQHAPLRVSIPDPIKSSKPFLFFLESSIDDSIPSSAPLINMGNHVIFGEDYHLCVAIPPKAGNSLRVEVHQLKIERRDTTLSALEMSHDIDTSNLIKGFRPSIKQMNGRPHFLLHARDNSKESGSFYLLKIPNSRFKNGHFQIRVIQSKEGQEDKILARRAYQNFWLDMPVTLYNLDLSISMMQYIVDEDQMRAFRRGNRAERKERFLAFWKERDPTPGKAYNELKSEYFRRIDDAYEQFTTPGNPGYDSDQGLIYIRNGEPGRRERVIPPDMPAREIWYYKDRTFIFEATTGFGDYKLIERK